MTPVARRPFTRRVPERFRSHKSGYIGNTDSVTDSVFVGFKKFLTWPMISVWRDSEQSTQEKNPMHDLIIALVFIGMVVAPAVVAAKSGTSESPID